MTPAEICQSNLIEARKRKEQMRLKFPLCAAFCDDYTQTFKDDLPPFNPILLWAKEGEERWGR